MRLFLISILFSVFHFGEASCQSNRLTSFKDSCKSQSNLLDTLTVSGSWISLNTNYPSGNKYIEERVYITEGCLVSDKSACKIRYQTQLYFDQKIPVMMSKQGYYGTYSDEGTLQLDIYSWWYNKKGKLLFKEQDHW